MRGLAPLALSLLAAGPATLAAASPASATAGRSGKSSAATPSAVKLLDQSIAALSRQPAIAGTETEAGTTLTYLVEPAKKATKDEVVFTAKGHTGQLDLIATGASLYLKGNVEGLAFITLGLVPAAQLAHLAGKWFKTSSASLSFAIPSFKPTLSGIGTLLCLNRTALSASSAALSGSASCSLAGTVVTRYSARSAVVTSKGLGDETITLTREHGALLPTSVTSTTRGKGTRLTVEYPSAAPTISAPAGASPLPSTL